MKNLKGILWFVLLLNIIFAAIIAPSSNLVITGRGATNNAAADGNINDHTTAIKEINGLIAESATYNATGLDIYYEEGIYKGLVPGEDYLVEFSLCSRGNNSDTVNIDVSLIESGELTWVTAAPTTVAMVPWQLTKFLVTVNPSGAYAAEKTTLNVDVALTAESAPNVVSYNAFPAANVSKTYNGAGVYGGVDLLSTQTLILMAQGYDLAIIDRVVEVFAPNGYDGLPVNINNIVPGSKVKYSLIIENKNASIATGVDLKDAIPANCHLYYTDEPTVNGSVNVIAEWKGATANVEPTANAVWFKITIPGYERVTASYTITVD